MSIQFTNIPRIVGQGMFNATFRLVFTLIRELQDAVRSITPHSSRGVGVHRTPIGTTYTARPTEETSTTAGKAGPARWS